MATIGQLVENNLGLIVSSAIAGLLAYAVGTTQTTGTIRDLNARLEVMEARAKTARDWYFCATRHIDAMENGGKPAQCELRGE